MPKRPPKNWFQSCVAGVKKSSPDVDDPESVCGDLWYNKMSASAKKKAVAKESLGEDSFDANLLETAMKTEGKDEVVDLMGSTKKVLNNMVSSFEKMRDAANKDMMDQKQYWSYVMNGLKEQFHVTDFMLAEAGLSTPMLMDCLDLDEQDQQTLVYKNLYLTKKDGSKQAVKLDDALAKIQPYTKNFESPISALVMGDPNAILKVFQKLYGSDVTAWSVPAEESCMSQLAAVVMVEMYNLLKLDKESQLFEKCKSSADSGSFPAISIKEGAVESLVEAFEKSDRQYLHDLFPNTLPGYPDVLIQETKTVINMLSTDEMDRLWPNINREYLVNVKERAKLQALAKKLEEMCGKAHGKKKQKKAEKGKKEEGKVPGVPDGTGPYGRGMGPGKGKADGSGLKKGAKKRPGFGRLRGVRRRSVKGEALNYPSDEDGKPEMKGNVPAKNSGAANKMPPKPGVTKKEYGSDETGSASFGTKVG